MLGVIDVGGGMRGIFGAGVFDRCIDDQVSFDCCIGVSAGAANVLAFLAGQRGRDYKFFYEYSFRKRYMSYWNFLLGHRLFNLDYVYDTLSGSKGEDPLDYPALAKYQGIVNIVTTDAETAEPVYFSLDDIHQDDYAVIKATCALPFFCKKELVYGRRYFDGGVANPVPLERAFELGCDKVVLILTKPRNVRRTTERDDKVARVIKWKHPEIARVLHQRAETYNRIVDCAEELEKEGKVLIVAPDDTYGVDTAKKTKEGLQALYDDGLTKGAAIRDYVK